MDIWDSILTKSFNNEDAIFSYKDGDADGDMEMQMEIYGDAGGDSRFKD